MVIIARIAQANGTQPACSSIATERGSLKRERFGPGIGRGLGAVTGLLSLVSTPIKRGRPRPALQSADLARPDGGR